MSQDDDVDEVTIARLVEEAEKGYDLHRLVTSSPTGRIHVTRPPLMQCCRYTTYYSWHKAIMQARMFSIIFRERYRVYGVYHGVLGWGWQVKRTSAPWRPPKIDLTTVYSPEQLAQLENLPKHDADCAIVTTHHLTCTCGAYTRARRQRSERK